MTDSKLPGLCESLGIKLAATHIGLVLEKKKAFPTDKVQGWSHDEFSVSLSYSGKGFDSSYKMGLGHRKLVHGATKERGGGYFYASQFKNAEEALKSDWLKIVPPTVADVMYCFLNDASGAEQSFKNWCEDFGYSDDSIKAWESYRACQETRDALIRMFGKEIFEQLVEACQDY